MGIFGKFRKGAQKNSEGDPWKQYKENIAKLSQQGNKLVEKGNRQVEATRQLERGNPPRRPVESGRDERGSKVTTPFADFRDLEGRMENPNKRINQVVRETAQETILEMKRKEFEETHKEIISLRKELRDKRELGQLGLLYTKQKSEYMQNYEKLCSSVPKEEMATMFLPYLIEKKELGIITEEEQKELNAMSEGLWIGGDSSNGTTSSYDKKFDNALVLLGAIGVLDFDENGFEINGYDAGKKIKLENLGNLGILWGKDRELLEKACLMAKQNGISIEKFPNYIQFAVNELKPLTSQEVGKGTIEAQNSSQVKRKTEKVITTQENNLIMNGPTKE